MKLDIVLVSYRSAPSLERSLPALDQFAPGARFIVVDNAPEDRAAEVVRRVLPAATLISNGENRGFAAAVNQALRAGNCDVILLANPDLLEIRGSVAAVLGEFAADPRLGALTGRLLNPDGSLQRNCRRFPRPFDFVSETLALHARLPGWQRPKRFRMLDWDYAQRRTVDAASGALLFVRRAAVEDVGLLDEQFFVYYEETDWLLRANQRGWRTLFLPEVEAVHAAGTSTEAGAQALSLLLLESQQSYARKHFGRGITGVLRIGLGLLDLVRAARALLPGTRRSSSTRDYRARVRLHLGGTSTSTDAFRPPTGR